MNWQEEYRAKLMGAAEALTTVRSGDRVWIQSGCGTPAVLVDALVARAPELRDVEVVHLMTLGRADYTRPEYAGHIRHRRLFLGANVREAVAAGRIDYTPIFLSEIEGLFVSGGLPLDVVLMQVSPPDAHGFVSLGTTVECTLTASRHAAATLTTSTACGPPLQRPTVSSTWPSDTTSTTTRAPARRICALSRQWVRPS